MKAFFTQILVLIVLVLLNLNITEGQSIKRQNISSLGTSSVTGGKLIRQTVGQVYFTSASSNERLHFLPGFQQPIFVYPKKKKKTQEIVNLIEIYPNPARNKVRIKPHKKIRDASLQVSNVNGALIYQKETSLLSGFTLNCSDWESGTYFVDVYDKASGEHYINKLIISK